MKTLPAICCLLVCLGLARGANILGVFHTGAPSHWILGNRLMLELAKAGHEVTVASNFPVKNAPKTYHFYDLGDLGHKEMVEEFINNAFNMAAENTPKNAIDTLNTLCSEMVGPVVKSPRVKELLASNATFDLVVIEAFYNDALIGLGYHFDCPVVALSTIGLTGLAKDLSGTPAPFSIMPNELLPFSKAMTLWQRLENTLFTLYEIYMLNFVYLPTQERFYDELIPDGGKPSLRELRRTKVVLVLLNSHFSFSHPKPLPPNVVEVGGMQIIREPEPLPADLEKFLQESPKGVIYFSMGSNLKSSKMSTEKRDAIVSALTATGLRVIWKWDDESIPFDPKVFLIRKWLPQDSILAHPKVKLFVTHGGLLSSTETLFHAKPVIGIPVFGDQQNNMDKVVAAGWGVRLDYLNLTEASFSWALDEVLGHPRYTENVQRLSRLYRDQPNTPLETAKFWVEYVIRHGGAEHLRLASVQMPWWEAHNFDVYAILFGVVTIPVLLVVWLLGLICSRGGKKVSQTRKNKSE